MNNYQESKLLDISRQFHIYGDLLHAEPCKIGHINETYIATYNQGGIQVRYVHQKINTHVFKDPDAVMNNFVRVTSHQRRKLVTSGARDASRRTLTVIPTRHGGSYYRNGDGECWRTLVFVEGVRTFEAVESPAQAYEAGKAFGDFQRLLVDLPGGRLAETIPHFHNTRKRFQALQKSIQEDHANRAKD
ncbi:MAG TPA: mucin desulfatase, partial [Candidatus Dormibacteraeota bacterium]|nr:mucin desulfatase [Candidatus Dormibacteraeota bacterium]